MKLLRVKEAGEVLGVKSASIRQLEKRGILRAVRDWSGHRRFREQDVVKLRKSLFADDEQPPLSKKGVHSEREAIQSGWLSQQGQ